MCERISRKPPPNSSSERKFEDEIAEMRINSFNLGLVSREMVDNKSLNDAIAYFSRSRLLAFNKKFYQMYLSSLLLLAETTVNKILRNCLCNENENNFIMDTKEVIQLISSGLSKLSDVSLSSDMKSIRKDILELESQCFVIKGNFKKAAKRYRSIRKKYRSLEDDYCQKCEIVQILKLKMESINFKGIQNGTNMKEVGQLYENLSLYILSVKCYKNSLCKLDTQNTVALTDAICRLLYLINLYNIVDQSLIRVLEEKVELMLNLERNLEIVNSNTICWIIVSFFDAWLGCKAAVNEITVVQINRFIDILVSSMSGCDCVKLKKHIHQTINLIKKVLPNAVPDSVKTNFKTEHVEEIFNEKDDEDFDEYQPEFSDIEFDKYELEELSTDSDAENSKFLSACQMEELETLGKRCPNKVSNVLKTNEMGETQLHVSARMGNFKQMKKHIEMGVPVDATDNAGWTALHEAANHGCVKAVQLLLDCGANMEHPGSVDCSTPLSEAINGGCLDVASFLINRGSNLWHKNFRGESICDALFDWRSRSKQAGEFKEKEYEAFKAILKLIKEKLGNKYSEWLRYRKGSSQEVIVDNPVEIQASKGVSERKQNKSRQLNFRYELEKEDSEENGEENSDNDDNNDSDNYVRKNKEPVHDYRRTMKCVRKGTKVSEEQKNSEDNVYSIRSELPGLPYDWLIDDMSKSTGSKKRERVGRSPDYGVFERSGRRTKRDSEDELFSKLKKRKRCDNFENENTGLSSGSEDLFAEDEKVTTTKAAAGGKIDFNLSSVTVKYREISLMIPLSAGLQVNVQWLIDETIRRYRRITNDTHYSDRVRLHIVSTTNPDLVNNMDAPVLFPDDTLSLVFAGLTAPVNLILTDSAASECSPANEPNLLSPATSSLLSTTKTDFQKLLDEIREEVDNSKVLDISYKIKDRTLINFLAFIQFENNLKGFRKIILKGNNINDIMLRKKIITKSGNFTLDQFFDANNQVEEVDLSENQISGNGFFKFYRNHKLLKLTKLNLSYNPIGTGFGGIFPNLLYIFPELTQVSLAGAQVTHLSEETIPDESLLVVKLVDLDLSNNPLQLNNFSKNFLSICHSLKKLSLRGCGKLLIQDKEEFVTVIADLVQILHSKEMKLISLDLGECNLSAKCLEYLKRLFRDRNCTVSTLFVDQNSQLRESPQDWEIFVQRLNTVLNLTIDLPLVNNIKEWECVELSCRSRVGYLNSLTVRLKDHLVTSVKKAITSGQLDLADSLMDNMAALSDLEYSQPNSSVGRISQMELHTSLTMAIWRLFIEKYGDAAVDVRVDNNMFCININKTV